MQDSGKAKSRSMKLKNLMKPIDLTTGKPWKVIVLYALPIMLSYIIQQIYTLADAMICGRVLSAEQVAGVNDTFPLTFIFLQFVFGCTAGFSVITARKVGNSDIEGIKKSFVTQAVLSVIISAILTAIAILTINPMLRAINVTPENHEVYKAAYDYCFVIFIGIFAQMGYNFICGILRAYGDSVTPLVFLGICALLNVGFDLLFLTGFGMGPAGAAIATVISQVISVVACFVYTFYKYKELRLKKSEIRTSWRDCFDHLKPGLSLGLQFSILAIGIVVMQGAVVEFDLMENGLMVPGTPAQNGFGAANKLLNFLMSFFQGLSAAVLGYNAQNYGKGDYSRIRKGTAQSLVIMLVITAFCTGVGLLLTINGAYQYIFLSADKISAESIAFGNAYMYTDMCLYVTLGVLFVLRGADQGIGKSGYVLATGVGELIARVVICAFAPALVNGGAVDCNASIAAFVAVCFGDPGAWIAACVILAIPAFTCIFKKYPDGSKPY